MEKIPFSIYDFFAYLSSGAVVLLTADYVWGLGLLSKQDVGPVLGVALVIVAYITGHVVAHFSSAIFEQVVVNRLLKSPTTLLLGEAPRLKLLAKVFRNYHRPLAANIQSAVHCQAQERGCMAAGEGLFQHVYPLVSAIAAYQGRLDDFRNQYGFARNMSFALFTSAATISTAHLLGNPGLRWRWAALTAVGGAAMFFRYLKFFRQFSYEMFLRYTAIPVSVPITPRSEQTATQGAR